jgi:hypothetical protein
MKNANDIQRWAAIIILVMFALQETNGGRFPSVYDEFWRSWSADLSRPLGQIAFGLIILLVAVCAFLRIRTATYAAVGLLAFEGIRALILCVSASDFRIAGREMGDLGAALISIMFLLSSHFGFKTQAVQQKR